MFFNLWSVRHLVSICHRGLELRADFLPVSSPTKLLQIHRSSDQPSYSQLADMLFRSLQHVEKTLVRLPFVLASCWFIPIASWKDPPSIPSCDIALTCVCMGATNPLDPWGNSWL